MPPEPELSHAQIASDGQDVVAAVNGLAGLVADVDDLDDVLARIAGLAVESVPGADGAAVTVVRAGTDAGAGRPVVLAWAVTAPIVREIDHLQYDICQEGPCLTAMQNRRAVISGSLGNDPRWPRFGARVARLQIHSALAMPLVVRDVLVGAINVYAHQRDAFSERTLRLGEQFAGPAAGSVRNIQLLHAASTQAAQLRTALTTRAVIDQAIGIIRSRSGGSADEAFDRLRQISQAENVKLATIAERLVDEAVRRAHARHNQS